MFDVTFAHSKLLWLLLVVPALVLLRWAIEARASRAVRAFTAARLRTALVPRRSQTRSWLVWSLYLLAGASLILALARPQWGVEKVERPDKGRNIFVAIDTSRSMLAKDVGTDRLTRSKLAAHDLITELKGERIGLLAFAGRAYLQAPLTTDHEAILESLQAFDHTIIEWGGSNVADLLDVTHRAVKNLPKSNYILVLFSDGGDADASLTSGIEQLVKDQVSIISVGVGTEGGTIIPHPEIPGEYIRDESGNVVRTRLERGVLEQLATATGGRYLRLGQQALSRTAIAPILARLREQESASKTSTRPIERFAWPLGLGMFFTMLAWIISSRAMKPDSTLAMRSAAVPAAAAIALLAILAPPSTTHAADGTLVSFMRQKGPTPGDARIALESKDWENARALYLKLIESGHYSGTALQELEYGIAIAQHHLTEYDGSERHFSEALQTKDRGLRARAHRGLGHSLYDQGSLGLAKQPKITLQRWMDALSHLNAAVDLEPENKHLIENRDHVAKMLEELRKALDAMEQKQKEQQGKKGSKGSKGDKGKQGQKGQQGEQGEGEEGSEGQQGQNDPNGSGEGDESKKTGEKKGEDDGIGGKDAQNLPQGNLQAAGNPGGQKPDKEGAGGDEPDKDKDGKKGSQGQKNVAEGDKGKERGVKADEEDPNARDRRNARTGFTPGEAEGLLRQYMDEITQFQGGSRSSIPPTNRRDW